MENQQPASRIVVVMSLRVSDWRIIGSVLRPGQLSPTFRRRPQNVEPVLQACLPIAHPSVLPVRGCRHLPEDPAAAQHGLGRPTKAFGP